MPKKLLFTADELKDYFHGRTVSEYAKDARLKADRLRVHADGIFPKEMIQQRRPHEDAAVQAYREIIWKAKTKPTFGKVFNSLSKIRRSADWAVNYPQDEFTRIPEGERLEDYTEKKFPFFTSVTNWVFSVLLREYLIDPNAVMIVQPQDMLLEPTAFFTPYPTIFSSANVLEYREENYCVLINPLGAKYKDADGREWDGKSFYVITTEQLLRYDQKNGKGEFELKEQINHGLGFMPAYQLKAVLVNHIDDAFLYESRINAMAEELDEAAREYSDLQAARVMNIYPERWEITTHDCKDCNGTGKVTPPTGGVTACEKCEGVGYVPTGPYSKMLLGRGNLDAAASGPIPVPPAGYVEKDIETVRVQDEGVEKHLYSALAAVNMEFLANTPLSQSGIAKEVDRDETTNFVHSVAEDIVRIMDWLYRCIAKWRYSFQYPNDDDIKAMLPTIPVPEHFDIFSTRFIEEDMKTAKENKLNPVIINSLELNYAGKKFSAEPEVRDRLMLIFELDPFPNISEDDKQSRLASDGISKIDYVISSNIQEFVKRALLEDENFAMLEYEKQRDKLKGYAQEIIDAGSKEKEALRVAFLNPNGMPDEEEPEPGQQQPPKIVNQ